MKQRKSYGIKVVITLRSEIMRLVKRCFFCNRLLRVKSCGFFRDENSGYLYLMTVVRCKSCHISSQTDIKLVGIRRKRHENIH